MSVLNHSSPSPGRFLPATERRYVGIAPTCGWLLLASVLLCCGCGPKSEIRDYEVESEHDEVYLSDLLRRDMAIPFEWDAPESWIRVGNDEFSKAAWKVDKEGDSSRITLSDLPGSAGLVPQLTRWRRQIAIQQASDDNPLKGTEPLELDGLQATYVDFKGDKETILGLLLRHGDKMWVFKYRGDTTVAERHRKTFRKFCESVTIPKTQGDD